MLTTYTSNKEAFEQENKQRGRKKKSAMAAIIHKAK
jgi:hemoglobin-like flavoprotein